MACVPGSIACVCAWMARESELISVSIKWLGRAAMVVSCSERSGCMVTRFCGGASAHVGENRTTRSRLATHV